MGLVKKSLGPLTGVVRSYEGLWFVVECADAPPHLRRQLFEGWQLRSAKVGDRVKLEYRNCGGGVTVWVVTEILTGGAE